MAKTAKFLKELIESAVFATLFAAAVSFVSLVLWVWVAFLYPQLDFWAAVKYTFLTVLTISVIYSWLDVWEHSG